MFLTCVILLGKRTWTHSIDIFISESPCLKYFQILFKPEWQWLNTRGDRQGHDKLLPLIAMGRCGTCALFINKIMLPAGCFDDLNKQSNVVLYFLDIQKYKNNVLKPTILLLYSNLCGWNFCHWFGSHQIRKSKYNPVIVLLHWKNYRLNTFQVLFCRRS